MRRIHHRKSRASQSELTTLNVWRVSCAIYRLGILIKERKRVRGDLLNIEQPIIKLFHPGSIRKRHSDELRRTKYLTILETVSCESHDDGE